MIFRLHNTRGSSFTSVEPSIKHVKDTYIDKPNFPIPELPFSGSYISRTIAYYEIQKDEIAYFFQPDRGKTHLSEAIVAHKRLVLLGGAGSGKSVELMKLVVELSHNSKSTVPIYKRFNTYTGQDIESYLPAGWEKVNPEDMVLLLDGLDEIQSQFFLIAVRKLLEFSNKHSKPKIVVSCRTNFYDLPAQNFSGTLEGFSVYTLDDISLLAIKEYSTKNLGIDGSQFIEEVHHASYLDLVHKPYFFHLLTNHYLKNRKFATHRSIVLEQALLDYFTIDKEHFKTSGVIVHRKKLSILVEKIAFVMEVMGKNFLSEDELLELAPLPLDFEKCKYLPAFKKHSFNDQWMFEHNNIQEYLASRVLSSKPFDKLIDIVSLPSGGEKRIKPTWTNTLSFLVSIGKDDLVQSLIDWIIKNDVEVLIRFDPDRLTKQKRIDIFKNIFESYSVKQIWLSSNKFTDEDLARFGYFTEILEYLLRKLQDTQSSAIVKFNAIRVLDKFNLSDFDQYRDEIRNTLLTLLNQSTAKFARYLLCYRSFGKIVVD